MGKRVPGAAAHGPQTVLIQGLIVFHKEDLSLEFPDEHFFNKEGNYP